MSLLARLSERGVIGPLDHQLAEALGRMADGSAGLAPVGAALASRAVGRGHVCVDLRALGAEPLLDADEEPVTDLALPALEDWREALRDSSLVHVGRPGEGVAPRPLVLDERDRLYLWRYADYQARLASALRRRAEAPVELDLSRLRDQVGALFAEATPGEVDRQRLATLIAARRRLAVISGGPGTGKTTTVARLLALLQGQTRGGRPLRMALVAPTGKAAQRLGEAIEQSAKGAGLDPAHGEIRASTIHRALGFRPQTPTRFRHGIDHPLSVDLVLADEASMIDLALMTKLVEAVPPTARLVLLGDRDQLASVEAGAILGDLFDPAAHPGYSEDFAKQVAALTGERLPLAPAGTPPIADCLVQLTKSYRYGDKSGIGALARAIKAGDADEAVAVLRGDAAMPYGEVAMAPLDPDRPFEGSLGRMVIDGYRGLFDAADPAERLGRLGTFRVLCAHRRGALGVEGMNGAVEHHLRRAGLIDAGAEHYDGRPILITRNDHQLDLFNGDVGIITRRRGEGPRAWFSDPRGGVRHLHPSRLPPHETVYAMTVHKSQGSELDRVALVLPSHPSPVLTRELVYTAISRARDRVDIHGDEAILRAAIARRIQRASGLREALWG